VTAGQRCAEVWYPPDSVNARVDAQLRRFAEQWYALQHGAAPMSLPPQCPSQPTLTTPVKHGGPSLHCEEGNKST
jgi:hypothetical protein